MTKVLSWTPPRALLLGVETFFGSPGRALVALSVQSVHMQLLDACGAPQLEVHADGVGLHKQEAASPLTAGKHLRLWASTLLLCDLQREPREVVISRVSSEERFLEAELHYHPVVPPANAGPLGALRVRVRPSLWHLRCSTLTSAKEYARAEGGALQPLLRGHAIAEAARGAATVRRRLEPRPSLQ